MKPMNLQPSTKITIFWSMVLLQFLLIWAALWVPDPTWKVWLAVGGVFMGTKVGFALLLELKARGIRLSPYAQRWVRSILMFGWVVVVVMNVGWFGTILFLWMRGIDPTTFSKVTQLMFPLIAIPGILIGFLSRPTVKYWGQPH
jgi:hypothetical protein